MKRFFSYTTNGQLSGEPIEFDGTIPNLKKLLNIETSIWVEDRPRMNFNSKYENCYSAFVESSGPVGWEYIGVVYADPELTDLEMTDNK